MRTKIVTREADTIAAAVIVNRKIDQPLITAGRNATRYEIRPKHAVAALAGHVVDPIDSQMEATRQETHATRRFSDSGGDDCAMLVTVTWKQVGAEFVIHALRQH